MAFPKTLHPAVTVKCQRHFQQSVLPPVKGIMNSYDYLVFRSDCEMVKRNEQRITQTWVTRSYCPFMSLISFKCQRHNSEGVNSVNKCPPLSDLILPLNGERFLMVSTPSNLFTQATTCISPSCSRLYSGIRKNLQKKPVG